MEHSIVYYIILVINIILIFFLTFPFITVLISLCIKEKKLLDPSHEYDFACVITGYQNAQIAVPLIKSFLSQKYTNFHIYFIADDCDLTNIVFPVSDKLTISKPPYKLGSKVKSFIYAIDIFVRKHQSILILDPDNLGHPAFLQELNKYFNNGFPAVQGLRAAKNLDSVYACMDATGELYYNYTQKYVPYLLNSSANIAGSGMAIEMDLFQKYLTNKRIAENLNTVIVAEDKILQNDLVGRGVRIAFAKNAIIFDEKVAKSDQVVRQRSRWLNSYFENIKFAADLILKGVFTFNFNKFLFGLLTVFPPMFLFICTSLAIGIIDIIFFPDFAVSLVVAGVIFVLNFLFVLYLAKAPKEIWQNLYGIPAFMFYQITALTKMKRANKDFLTTAHTKSIDIESLLKEKEDKK